MAILISFYFAPLHQEVMSFHISDVFSKAWLAGYEYPLSPLYPNTVPTFISLQAMKRDNRSTFGFELL